MHTNWTEEELTKYQDKENFSSFRISQPFDSNFGRKTKKSIIRTLPALAPFVSPLPILGPLASALINISIYLTQPSGIKLAPETYATPALSRSRTRPTGIAYMQPLEPTFAAYI